nr:hypothetical protein [Deltaproteobacteria bacterium]
MEIGESVATGGLSAELKEKCPFKRLGAAGGDEADELLEDDDRDEIQAEQSNDGGLLGRHLASGSAGIAGVESVPFPPGDYCVKIPRPEEVTVPVPGTSKLEWKSYPVTLAAHHLIPGNASLGRSALYDFLGPSGSGKLKAGSGVRKRTDVEAGDRTYTIERHIGYDINGSHNGAWLPGNYAIQRAGKMSPVADLSWRPWVKNTKSGSSTTSPRPPRRQTLSFTTHTSTTASELPSYWTRYPAS